MSDPWTDQGAHSAAAARVFSPALIAAASGRTDTGLALHQSPATCRHINAALAADAPDSLELVRYDGSSQAANPSPLDVRMEKDHAADRHVRLMFKAGATVAAGSGTLTVTVNATSNTNNADCSVPGSRSYEWKLTMTSTPGTWTNGSYHDEIAADDLTVEGVSAAGVDTWTGLALQHTAAGCDERRLALAASSQAAFGLHRYDGSVRETSALANEVAFSGDEHVRVYLRGGHQHAEGVTTATLVASGDCVSWTRPLPQTLELPVTLADPTAWRLLPADQQTPNASHRWSALEAGQLATGVRIHRNSDYCRFIDVELLEGADYLELVRYTAAGDADGSGAARQAAVRMEAGVAADRHVRLLFKAGAYPAAGALTATVRVAAAGCEGQSQPTAADLSYTLNVLADTDPAPALRVTPPTVTISRNAVATGIRVVAIDNDDDDVAVRLDAAAERLFELQGATGEYELRATAALTVGSYTVTLTATDDNGPAQSSTARAVVSVREGSAAATQAAAADAGGAMVRALGMSGIDAVLERPAAGAGAGMALLEMLAAKEQELESGEIDLREFLEGQSVALPLKQTGGAGGIELGVWLAGSRHDLGGVETDSAGEQVYVDGDLASTSFGVDARRGQVRAGLGYGLHKTTANYGLEASRGTDAPSSYELDLRALQPYVAFDVEGMQIALAFANGSGDLILRPEGEEAARPARDVDYVGYAAGFARRLPLADGELRLRGSYVSGELDVAEAVDGLDLDAEGSVLRLGLGYGRSFDIGQEAVASPFLEAGYLIMDGDGTDGSSGLLQGGVRFAGGQLAGGFSYQQALDDDMTLAGYDFSFRFGSELDGLGLGLEADPGYGLRGTEELLAKIGAGRSLALADEDEAGLRGGAGLSYGLAVAGGVLTPYGRWGVGAGGELGLRLRAGARRSWALGYGAAADEVKLEYRLGD